MFYNFGQNNSGGFFNGDVYTYIIEADSEDEANKRALRETDIYFDGVENGYDCDCCGDRWSRVWRDSGTNVPEMYGTSMEDYESNGRNWDDCDIIRVLYKDGSTKDYKY